MADSGQRPREGDTPWIYTSLKQCIATDATTIFDGDFALLAASATMGEGI
jgi:hypothetical protein